MRPTDVAAGAPGATRGDPCKWGDPGGPGGDPGAPSRSGDPGYNPKRPGGTRRTPAMPVYMENRGRVPVKWLSKNGSVPKSKVVNFGCQAAHGPSFDWRIRLARAYQVGPNTGAKFGHGARLEADRASIETKKTEHRKSNRKSGRIYLFIFPKICPSLGPTNLHSHRPVPGTNLTEPNAACVKDGWQALGS
jgi:hypothetical protein